MMRSITLFCIIICLLLTICSVDKYVNASECSYTYYSIEEIEPECTSLSSLSILGLPDYPTNYLLSLPPIIKHIGALRIGRQANFINLDGLQNVEAIDELYLYDNERLQSLYGLNPNLSIMWEIQIYNNPSLNDTTQLFNANVTLFTDPSWSRLKLANLPLLDIPTINVNIPIPLNALNTVLFISFVPLRNLNILSIFPGAYQLTLDNLYNLTDITALTNFKVIHESLLLINLPLLTDISPLFNNLTLFTGDFDYYNKLTLNDLPNINTFISMDSTISIQCSYMYVFELANVNNIINFNAFIFSNPLTVYNFNLTSMNSLINVDGLQFIELIDESLYIEKNINLQSLTGLYNIKDTVREMRLVNLPSIIDLNNAFPLITLSRNMIIDELNISSMENSFIGLTNLGVELQLSNMPNLISLTNSFINLLDGGSRYLSLINLPKLSSIENFHNSVTGNLRDTTRSIQLKNLYSIDNIQIFRDITVCPRYYLTIDGLSNLKYINFSSLIECDSEISINNCISFTNFTNSFPSLQKITTLILSNNVNLYLNEYSLSQITAVMEDLIVYNNSALIYGLSFLSNINYIGEQLVIQFNGWYNNPYYLPIPHKSLPASSGLYQTIDIDYPDRSKIVLPITLEEIRYPVMDDRSIIIAYNPGLINFKGINPKLKYYYSSYPDLNYLSGTRYASGLGIYIHSNPHLIDFTGSNFNTSTIWGDFFITNPRRNLTPLRLFVIAYNPKLQSLTGLEGIENVIRLIIHSNPELTSIYLPNLQVIGYDSLNPNGVDPIQSSFPHFYGSGLYITNNYKLSDLSFNGSFPIIQDKRAIMYGLIIVNNSAITTLSALHKFVSMYCIIENNPPISDYISLPTTATILNRIRYNTYLVTYPLLSTHYAPIRSQDFLRSPVFTIPSGRANVLIEYNPSLTDIYNIDFDLLESVALDESFSIIIQHNLQLTTISLNIFDRTPALDLIIHNNPKLASVESASKNSKLKTLQLSNLPKFNLLIDFRTISVIDKFTIENLPIISLQGLNILVAKQLILKNNHNLRSLEGLNNLASSQQITFSNNTNLVDLMPLTNLRTLIKPIDTDSSQFCCPKYRFYVQSYLFRTFPSLFPCTVCSSILSLQPNSGPITGGTQIILEFGLVDLGEFIYVKFGNNTNSKLINNPNIVKCYVYDIKSTYKYLCAAPAFNNTMLSDNDNNNNNNNDVLLDNNQDIIISISISIDEGLTFVSTNKQFRYSSWVSLIGVDLINQPLMSDQINSINNQPKAIEISYTSSIPGLYDSENSNKASIAARNIIISGAAIAFTIMIILLFIAYCHPNVDKSTSFKDWIMQKDFLLATHKEVFYATVRNNPNVQNANNNTSPNVNGEISNNNNNNGKLSRNNSFGSQRRREAELQRKTRRIKVTKKPTTVGGIFSFIGLWMAIIFIIAYIQQVIVDNEQSNVTLIPSNGQTAGKVIYHANINLHAFSGDCVADTNNNINPMPQSNCASNLGLSALSFTDRGKFTCTQSSTIVDSISNNNIQVSAIECNITWICIQCQQADNLGIIQLDTKLQSNTYARSFDWKFESTSYIDNNPSISYGSIIANNRHVLKGSIEHRISLTATSAIFKDHNNDPVYGVINYRDSVQIGSVQTPESFASDDSVKITLSLVRNPVWLSVMLESKATYLVIIGQLSAIGQAVLSLAGIVVIIYYNTMVRNVRRKLNPIEDDSWIHKIRNFCCCKNNSKTVQDKGNDNNNTNTHASNGTNNNNTIALEMNSIGNHLNRNDNNHINNNNNNNDARNSMSNLSGYEPKQDIANTNYLSPIQGNQYL